MLFYEETNIYWHTCIYRVGVDIIRIVSILHCNHYDVMFMIHVTHLIILWLLLCIIWTHFSAMSPLWRWSKVWEDTGWWLHHLYGGHWDVLLGEFPNYIYRIFLRRHWRIWDITVIDHWIAMFQGFYTKQGENVKHRRGCASVGANITSPCIKDYRDEYCQSAFSGKDEVWVSIRTLDELENIYIYTYCSTIGIYG